MGCRRFRLDARCLQSNVKGGAAVVSIPCRIQRFCECGHSSLLHAGEHGGGRCLGRVSSGYQGLDCRCGRFKGRKHLTDIERIIRIEHRALESFHGCEKCGKLTNWQVKVVDRWATWCGCGNSVREPQRSPRKHPLNPSPSPAASPVSSVELKGEES